MTSAGKVTSSVYKMSNSVTSYFHLYEVNEELHRQNAMLEREIIGLRNIIQDYKSIADTTPTFKALNPYSFIITHVINNSISHPHNYITIDKGSNDGIKPEMGVVDHNGVVGIVNVVAPHSARIISLLNPNFRLSCRVKGSDGFGSLIWDGKSYEEAILEELPKHTNFNVGDTIITSGFSAVFPEGIPVGTVICQEQTSNDNFFTLRIKLLTDFSRLSTVKVVVNSLQDEINYIEQMSLSNQ